MDASNNFYLPETNISSLPETNISYSADHSSSLLCKRNYESFTDADFDEEEEEKNGASSSSSSSLVHLLVEILKKIFNY